MTGGNQARIKSSASVKKPSFTKHVLDLMHEAAAAAHSLLCVL